MDFATDEQMAAFRYGLIAPIVSRQTPVFVNIVVANHIFFWIKEAGNTLG